MNRLNDAIQKDIEAARVYEVSKFPNLCSVCRENLLQAVEIYEELVDAEDKTADLYMNLGFIYWQVTDFGFNSSLTLDVSFVQHGAERYKLILQKGLAINPGNTELQFWQGYCEYMALGNKQFEVWMRRFEEVPGESLVPFFHLFVLSEGKKHKTDAIALLDFCKRMPTLKNRYVQSVLESVISSFPRIT